MSDPVTNIEIEDVLSSIRRLVSGDERPEKSQVKAVERAVGASAPAASNAHQFETARDEPEKLVLTPSLRVDSPAPFVVEPADQVSETSLVDSPVSDFDHTDNAPDENDAPDEARSQLNQSNELKARVAEFEEVVARQSDQWDPDGASADANSGEAGSPLPWEEEEDDSEAPDAENEQKVESSTDLLPEDIVKAIEDAALVSADAVDNSSPEEGPATRAEEQSEDDIPENFAADDNPQDVDSAQRPGPEAPDNAEVLGASDDFLDEDALRDLVADIVRQELQGALGERITRNVRKLVRREIHRAMASQELN